MTTNKHLTPSSWPSLTPGSRTAATEHRRRCRYFSAQLPPVPRRAPGGKVERSTSVQSESALVCGRWKRMLMTPRKSPGNSYIFWEGCRLPRTSPAGKSEGGQFMFSYRNHRTPIARRNHTRGQRRSLALEPLQRPFRMIQRKWAYNGDIFTLADCFRSSGSANCLRNWKTRTTKMPPERKGSPTSKAGSP